MNNKLDQKELTIIKIGGSILTNKNSASINQVFKERITRWHNLSIQEEKNIVSREGSFYEIDLVKSVRDTIRRDKLAEFASILNKQRLNLGSTSFLIIHGAGSVGHTLALEFPSEIVKHMCLILNQEITSNLLKSIPAISLPSITQFVGTVVHNMLVREAELKYDHIFHILDSGHVPVLYGDMILTDDGQWAILSGDLIPLLLQERIEKNDHKYTIKKIKEVIMISDYPEDKYGGLYTKNPDLDDAVFVKKIVVNQNNQKTHVKYFDIDNNEISQEEISADEARIDKSKGILGKIEDSIKLAKRYNIHSRLIGLHEFEQVLSGEDLGTRIVSDEF